MSKKIINNSSMKNLVFRTSVFDKMHQTNKKTKHFGSSRLGELWSSITRTILVLNKDLSRDGIWVFWIVKTFLKISCIRITSWNQKIRLQQSGLRRRLTKEAVYDSCFTVVIGNRLVRGCVVDKLTDSA
ncbi:hypothetical protein BpHYR1_011931 [Brachionus plicatilis]|uniref:Uncharacterized protein n=1 Tax=Brachionus plicatilis TaxID=10195 RepID=A0A3M7SMD0_BRAPC|nr:hypothetical protein BpHYR1_011931 [Brachionus plicatilis]